MRAVVIGAGAFGGWTALRLREAGGEVVLIDAWGAGNARSSSGGDTRVFRHTYGPERIYVELAARSLDLWREYQERFATKLYEQTGVLWLVGDDDSYVRAARPYLDELGVSHARLDLDELSDRFPQVSLSGVQYAHWEDEAGLLYARRACEAVQEAFIASGGEVRCAQVRPGEIASGRMASVHLSDGEELDADLFVFACGPWLGTLFPDLVAQRMRPTRQEVFTFGVPPGDLSHVPPALPVWVDQGERFWYGIPGNERRGFKVADDTRGPEFDPTSGDRTPTAEGLARAREKLAMRFPGLADAPLVESRVCQYADTPDGNFLLDRHPAAQDVWLVGGGSGHGFKHGPAVGELVTDAALGRCEPEESFRLSR